MLRKLWKNMKGQKIWWVVTDAIHLRKTIMLANSVCQPATGSMFVAITCYEVSYIYNNNNNIMHYMFLYIVGTFREGN